MNKTNYAVIGLGWFGEKHCEALSALPGVELFALCTRRAERLQAGHRHRRRHGRAGEEGKGGAATMRKIPNEKVCLTSGLVRYSEGANKCCDDC